MWILILLQYGETGLGFIEAHHKNALAEAKGQRETRKEDIALVCSNCHRMLHKGNPVFELDWLKKSLKH